MTVKTLANINTKDGKIAVLLKYLSNFWRTPEMPLVKFEINLILNWSSTCVTTNSTGEGTFEINYTKLCVPVVTLSTQDNAKLPEQVKSDFKSTTNWNKHLAKTKTNRKTKPKFRILKMIQFFKE